MSTLSWTVLSKTGFCDLPDEIIRMIDTFLKWDVCSMEFAKHLSNGKHRKWINEWMPTVMNRKNGFRGQEICDTEDEHWAFGLTNNHCLQAISCKTCGEYQVSGIDIPTRLFCLCR